MEFRLNEAGKCVEIWLSNAEKTDAPLRESLKSVYTAYKNKNYLIAVFESGKGDLFKGMKDLLLHNR